MKPVAIARCPEHGLHGCRDSCYVCGGPVEQVEMIEYHARVAAWRGINLTLAIAWLVAIPVAYFAGWLASVTFVAAISIYANVAGHVAAWRADVPNDD